MKNGIFYHKSTGQPVQIIARAQTKPTFQEVICYQELTDPYDHYVMEKRQFFAEYVRKFEELPLVGQKQLGKREDLPDKQPRISKGEVAGMGDGAEEDAPSNTPDDEGIQKMVEFFDADSYWQKLKLFDKMADDLDEHILYNIAVSLDISLEDVSDISERIRTELRMRSKYEGERGDRL